MLNQVKGITAKTELDKKAYEKYEEYIDIQGYYTQYTLDLFLTQKKSNKIKLFYEIALKQLRLDKLNKLCI